MKMYHTFLLHLLEFHRDCRPKTDTSIGLLLARYSPALAVQDPGSAGASKNPTKKKQKIPKNIKKTDWQNIQQKNIPTKKIGQLVFCWQAGPLLWMSQRINTFIGFSECF